MVYYVYILGCIDGSYYTGITTDIERRIKEHYFKLPQCAKYTRSHSVISLEALWTTKTKAMASKLEYRIKRLSKHEKQELIKAPDNISQAIPQLNSADFDAANGFCIENYIN